jgi:hypothetical protein
VGQNVGCVGKGNGGIRRKEKDSGWGMIIVGGGS